MLVKPDLQDERLAECLSAGYGLRVARLEFLPLGADINTAVYRADAADGAYFVKLRRGPFDELSLALPAFLSGRGIAQIIAPIRSASGRLWQRLEPYTVALYPFVAGANGYRAELSQAQWVEFGATLRCIHDAPLPAALRHRLPVESWSPQFRAQVRAYRAQLRDADSPDPLVAELAELMRAEAAVIDELVEGAERLGRALQARPQEMILCHADMHAGNLLITPSDALYIVDWDTALLAPKERDLMFPGSGLGPGWDRAETTGWFYHGYSRGHGATEVDRAALAYYRGEREVQDIAAFCEQILSTSVGEDRRQSLVFLASTFRPGGIADIALESYREAAASRRR